MNVAESLAHSKWVCKYHIVFIPKYRRKALFGELRRHLGEVFKELARQKECTIEEGHLRASPQIQGRPEVADPRTVGMQY